MVRETKSLGQGTTTETRPQEMPTVKNIAVYDSTRQIQSWELARIASKVTQSPHKHIFINKMFENFERGRYYPQFEHMYANYSPDEPLYRALVEWRYRQENSLGQVRAVANVLKQCHMEELAESLEP
ncbi:hypothetical protein FSP39_006278 [Pinctada imbricata]|uniref:Death domain-containing protein n=1 Tax=Pinctada imbricata TaxID=66713 RepID=A0AA89CA08_PINIB|nr:hypothetical protein FSP39_006278 [Pinctada imbricata]